MTTHGREDDEHVLHQDGYDLAAYEQAREDLPDLADIEERGAQKDPAFRVLLEDIHASLYKLAPTLDPGGSVSALHEGIISEMMQTTEWDKLRATTVLNEGASALGVVEIAKQIIDKIPPMKRHQTNGVAIPQQMTLLGTKDRDAMRRALRRMVREASEATEESLDDLAILGHCGGSGYGSGLGQAGTTDVREVAAVRSQIKKSTLLKDIMALAGRMRRMALRKHADRVRHGPDELVDIEVGGDIGRALPTELVMLKAHPALRRDLILRLAENQVLQYRLEGREKQGKGPVVVCIDTSASMQGGREIWSKAIALGLLAIAILERRDFALILFSDEGQARMFEYERRPHLDTVVASLGCFFGSGTDFVTPLDLAMDLCSRPGKLDRADIVFITDGECRVDPAWGEKFWKRREEKGTRLYSIIIGTSSPTMTWLSDGVAHIHNLHQDAEATDLAFGSV